MLELRNLECSTLTLCLLLCRHSASSLRGLGLRGSVRRRLVGGPWRGSQCLEKRRVLEHLSNELLRAGLAVHVCHQVSQVLTRLEKRLESIHLPGDSGRREVIHAI